MDDTSPAATTAISPRPGAVPHQPLRLTWRRKLTASIAVTDAIVIAMALVAAHLVRFGLDSADMRTPEARIAYGWLGVVIGVGWLVALSANRSRVQRIIGVGMTEYVRVINATLITFGALAISAFLAQVDIARGYLAVALPLGLVGLLLGRLFWRRSLQQLRRAGRCLTGAIIVGPRGDVVRTLEQLSRNLTAGYRPIAVVITSGDQASGDALDLLPRIGIDDLVGVSKKTRTRAVMIAGNLPGGRAQIRDIGWDLENSKVELILVSRLTDVAGPRIHLRPVEGLPMVHVDLPQYSGFNHSVKRVFDVVLAALALLILSPVFLALAIAVRLDSPGPVLFRQERVGQQGSRFTMLKFRSMVVDAEARLASLEQVSDGNGVLFKMRDDPRVTRVGGFLRRYSLDELPQLFNALSGEMSLIGPRPPLPAEIEHYKGRVGRRLLTKPGITGLWQVNGRSNLSWEESVKLDLYYVENWSVTGDFLILLRTVRAVIGKDGAY